MKSLIPWGFRVYGGVMLLGLSMAMSGCNLANSANGAGTMAIPVDSTTTGTTTTTTTTDTNTTPVMTSVPVASISIVNPSSDNVYLEQQNLTIDVSGTTTNGAVITECMTSLYQLKSTDVFGSSGTLMSSLDTCGQTTMLLPTAGRYLLKLQVTDSYGKTAKASQSFVVSSNPLNAEFSVVQGVESINSTGSMRLNLDASKSLKGAAGEIKSYAWTVQLKVDDSATYINAQTQTNKSPTTSMVVNTDGVYVVHLTITDTLGNSDSEQQQVFVSSNATSRFIPNFDMSWDDGTGAIVGVAGAVAAGNLVVTIDNTNLLDINHGLCSLFLQDPAATPTAGVEPVPTEFAYADFVNSVTPNCYLPIIVAGIYVVELKVVSSLGTEYIRRKVITIN